MDRLKEESHQKDLLLQETVEEQIKMKARIKKLQTELDELRTNYNDLAECNEDVIRNQQQLVQDEVKQKNEEIEKLKEEVKAKTAQVGQYKKQKQIAPELEEEVKLKIPLSCSVICDLYVCVQFQIKLATCQSKLEGTESLFKELSRTYQEMEAKLMKKVNAKDSEIQKMQAKCHAMVTELKKHEAKQQMAQRESEIQLAQVEQQKTVIVTELSQLQKERKREDEFSKAFQQEFEANKFLRAKCAEFENQLGIAYDSLDVSHIVCV